MPKRCWENWNFELDRIGRALAALNRCRKRRNGGQKRRTWRRMKARKGERHWNEDVGEKELRNRKKGKGNRVSLKKEVMEARIGQLWVFARQRRGF